MKLSDSQNEAIKKIKEWYYNETDKKQCFRLFGYAGCGKTTIMRHAIGEIGLTFDGESPEVRAAAFTGKAALCMQRAGTPARTIHSLIYSLHEATEEEIQEA